MIYLLIHSVILITGEYWINTQAQYSKKNSVASGTEKGDF